MFEGFGASAVPGDFAELFVGGEAPTVADEGIGAVDEDGVHAEVEDVAVATGFAEGGKALFGIDFGAELSKVFY